MICYLDSSVVLRTLLNQRPQFLDWGEISAAISSQLLSVECNRILDRYRLEQQVNDIELAQLKRNLSQFMKGVTLYEVSKEVLARAEGAFPSIVGTFDAIHLSTALLWKEKNRKSIKMLSFDTQLNTACIALGFETLPAL